MIERHLNADQILENDLKSREFHVDQSIKELQKGYEDFTSSLNITRDEAVRMIDDFVDIVKQAPSLTIALFMTVLDENRVAGQRVVENAAELFTTYGFVHTGLLINDVPVHWNRDSLVTFSNDPTYCLACIILEVQKCSMQQSSIDNLKQRIHKAKDDKELRRIVNLGFTIAEKQLEKHAKRCHDILQKVAERCAYFNCSKKYRVLRCNCQDFVGDILHNLKVSFEPEDEFKIFMERIRNSKFELGEFNFKRQTFRNRKIFDEYVNNHWEHETSQWNKKLLIQYSMLMNKLYLDSSKQEEKWGPMDEQVWDVRWEEVYP